MREIEFRGKILFNNEQWKWITGDIEHFTASDGREMVRIRPKSGHKEFVIPKTVGQWTGLFDISGNRLYEGDVVETKSLMIPLITGVLIYSNRLGAYMVYGEDGNGIFVMEAPRFKLLGNIFDNPEFKKYKEVYFRED